MILLVTVLFFGLVTAQPLGVTDVFVSSGGDHPFEVQVVSHIDNGGILGNVFMAQRRSNDHTKLSAMFEGLQDAPGDSYGLYILDYPTNRDAQNPCDDLGDIYDPDGNLGTSNYTERCRADHTQCAIGDLATRHGGFNATDEFIDFGRDFNLPTSGPRSVVGRSIVVRRLDGDDSNLACSNIEVPTQSRVLRGRFSTVMSGDVFIILPRYDYVDYTKNEKTLIIVDLERIDGGPPNTNMHGWQIQRGYADSGNECDKLDPILGQRTVRVGDDTCSESNHRTCPLGDLTAKCGTLSVVNNRMRAFCTDNQLGLVSFSTLDRAVLSILAPLSNRIMECVQLEEQRPSGVIINFRNLRTQPAVFVHVVFSQLTQFDPIYYRTYIIRLNGDADNLIVYDGDNPDLTTCTNLGDVLGGMSTVANPRTSDQYPAGELGPKIGGLMGKRESRTHGLTSSIPISDIIGRPVALTRSDGTIWGCGEVQNYYNAPYMPPDDVVDYLDIWKGPSQ
ncbi:uncharacterized protein [Dysidea avara]|uniref:uncharacterized protein n=1 Tax=Dysidea avara TaxID=196820 RepID=UPI00332A4FAD